jgi:hypothetical protein
MTNPKPEKDEITLSKLALEYADNDKAREFLESMRWPNGAFCPHCKATKPYTVKGRSESRSPARSRVEGAWESFCKIDLDELKDENEAEWKKDLRKSLESKKIPDRPSEVLRRSFNKFIAAAK